MSFSLTVSSQITGISKTQKQEVVKTLVAYPLVLSEVDVLKELSKSQLKTISLLEQTIQEKDKVIANYQLQTQNYQSQIKLFNKQLKKEKLNKFIVGGSGVALIVLAFLVK